MPDYGYRSIPENQWLDLLGEIKELKAQLEAQQSQRSAAQVREALETLKPAYEVLKPTVNPNACPCEFCRARDELIEGVGRLIAAGRESEVKE